MKVNSVKDKGWVLLSNLFKQAADDKRITFDEGRILRATDLNVSKLLDFTEAAWEDKNLSETEKQRILFMIKKIQDDATTLAEYDDIVTNEEDEMLGIIRNLITEFYAAAY